MPVAAELDTLYRTESRRVLATLIRLLRDFDLAEEALHDAFLAAAERWPVDGIPEHPVPWLISTGRFKAVDRVRRRAVYDRKLARLAVTLEQVQEPIEAGPSPMDDDRLRLIFTCCHPALAPEARVALTLRTVCGLTTEEIARAFLVPAPTLAQRIVRAKARIRDAGIPYVVPAGPELTERLEGVLQVVYLVFNEGYSPSAGAAVTRADLAQEAIRLARLLVALTGDAEADGLLALLLLQDARRHARTTAEGDLVLLEDQDRTRWDQSQLREGLALVMGILRGGDIGPYGLQAAIAAEHARAASAAATNWAQIVSLYDLLMRSAPTPVVALNRAVAIAMWRGPQAGLDLLDAIAANAALDAYAHLHSARADLLRRAGRMHEAREAYTRALALTTQAPEQRFLAAQLRRAEKERG